MKILSCGAGQQSTALALMSCENAIAKKANNKPKFPLVPVYDAIIFCDLGIEREWVYKQVIFLKERCEKFGIPFYILQNRNLKEDFVNNYGVNRVTLIPFWSLSADGKKGKMRRHCTIDYKILQIQNFVKWNLLKYKKGERIKSIDIQNHEMHFGFSYEEKHRSFESKHKLFVNKYPLVEMKLTRKDNYAYVKETWGLETKGSACLCCPFHTNFFFYECKCNCQKDFSTILAIDEKLENGIPNKRIGVPDSKVFISKSRKRIRDLTKEECQDAECFLYNNEKIWNGL